MAVTWTANLDTKSTDGGNVVVTATFRSSLGEKITRTNRGDTLDKAAVDDWAARVIESLLKRDEALETLVVGPITPKKIERTAGVV